jgi:hypothetical protein
MADIAHTVPASVLYLDGSNFGLTRPGLQVTPFISGRFLSRDWHGHNVAEYDLQPALFNSSDDTLEEWEAFWHQIDGGGAAGYIVDPVSAVHRDLLCGGIADGSQTTFPVPVIDPASLTVFVDGVPDTAYTLGSAANVLSETTATCEDNTLYTPRNADALADAAGVSMDGIAGSIKVTADAANGSAHVTAYTSGLDVGDTHTTVAVVLNADTTSHSMRVLTNWYTSVPAYVDATVGDAVDVGPGEWVALSVSGDVPATTDRARSEARMIDSDSTDVFYLGGMSFGPGDYTRWHLPSVAPGLIEFAAAPSSGARVTATATGKRVTRCRFEPGTRWSMTAAGHSMVRSIRATEWVEF